VHTSALLWSAGRWREAAEHGDRAIEIATRIGQGHQPVQWRTELARGDWPTAAVVLEKALPRAVERRDMQHVAYILFSLCDVLLRLDRPAEAERQARLGLVQFSQLDFPLMRGEFPPRLAESLALRGEHDEAARLARASVAEAERWGVPELAARAERALALALAGRGATAAAHQAFLAATRRFEQIQHTFEAARTIELHATHVTGGTPAAGGAAVDRAEVPTLEAALARYESLPAPHDVARLRRAISHQLSAFRST